MKFLNYSSSYISNKMPKASTNHKKNPFLS